MKYKAGDKVVVEIKHVDKNDSDLPYKIGGYHSDWCSDNDILGKLEDFQPAQEKIKMTADEKKEFDKLKERYVTPYAAMSNMFKDNVPHLFKKVNTHESDEKRAQNQFNFFKAFEYPGLIEVVKKEKKYYVHLFKLQAFGYLNQHWDYLEFLISDKSETDQCKTQFTKDEIENLKDLGFKINDDALEEVEDE